MIMKFTADGKIAGKVADVELHFTSGILAGLKLIGFSVWERRMRDGFNVTFPARQFSVNGERRSFALLRPTDDSGAQKRITDLIIEGYRCFEVGQAEHPEHNAGLVSVDDVTGAIVPAAVTA